MELLTGYYDKRRVVFISKTLSGANLAGMSETRDRVKDDYYATPPEATKSILDQEILDGDILECACGEGHISEVIKAYYPNSDVMFTDLVNRGMAKVI